MRESAAQQQQPLQRLGSGLLATAVPPLEGVIEEEYNPERAAALSVPRSSTPTNETPINQTPINETPDMRRKNRLGFSMSRSEDSFSANNSMVSVDRQLVSPSGSQHSSQANRSLTPQQQHQAMHDVIKSHHRKSAQSAEQR